MKDIKIGSRYGSLVVIGNNGLKGCKKKYYVECDVCSKDKELFGEITTTKQCLEKGIMPCGCSKSPKWSEEQTLVRLRRKLNSIGLNFVSLPNGYNKGKDSTCIYSCDKHGEKKTTIGNVINQLTGCKNCSASEARYATRYKKIPELLQLFKLKHGDDYDYSLIKEPKAMKDGVKIICKKHGEFTQSIASHLIGKGCPKCSGKNFKYCYINSISDGVDVIAVKFGVAVDVGKRIKYQKSKSKLKIDNLDKWLMPSSESCLMAESMIKNSIITGVVSKFDMVDGWTETASFNDIGKIRIIIESFGGVSKKGA